MKNNLSVFSVVSPSEYSELTTSTTVVGKFVNIYLDALSDKKYEGFQVRDKVYILPTVQEAIEQYKQPLKNK